MGSGGGVTKVIKAKDKRDVKEKGEGERVKKERE